ncbi:MAG: hypothetical protein ACOCVV_04630 [Marinobacter sp.]
MKHDTSGPQADLLNRLYENKQKQLTAARKHGNTLLYRVLEAEARAISDALNATGRR